MRFRTTLIGAGKTALGINVPAEVVESLGRGKRPPVKVTINGYTYRNTVAVMGGEYMVGVSAEHRQGAGVGPGDEVDIDMELDTAPREVEVPPEFAKALKSEPAAKKKFESLSYSGKLTHVAPIANAKTAETRDRNIAKAISALKG
ncbi:MAG: YdeI/OmpD-associated family protein [Candidatus Dormiibacterota bacterium]